MYIPRLPIPDCGSPHQLFSNFISLSFYEFPTNYYHACETKNRKEEHSNETISVILALHSAGKSQGKIADCVKIPKSTVTRILQRALKNPNEPYRKTKRVGRSTKLNAWSQRALIRHVERFPHDNIAALGTPSKSGHTLSRGTIRSYLKTAGYLRFKARRKPFLTQKHMEARLRWAREHVDWTLEDWKRVIWTDEATFTTGLDSRSCYVTVTIFKTHIQEWEINIGHLGGHNIWKKRSGVLFSQKRPNDIGNLC